MILIINTVHTYALTRSLPSSLAPLLARTHPPMHARMHTHTISKAIAVLIKDKPQVHTYLRKLLKSSN